MAAPSKEKDTAFMHLALDLARKGLGGTWPNPMVGAVIVRDGQVVGQGWHRQVGSPHAEILALREAGLQAQGADLYINLEPCSHQGKTPPCAPAVIEAGIKRVVAAMKDPNPKVSGRGFRQLRKAGLQVDVGLLEKEAQALNEVFVKCITTGLPFVVCKAALSLDGKIACANGISRWISGTVSRRYAHGLRAMADAVIVGMGTVLQDDPQLSVRLAPKILGKTPLKVVLEGRRRLSQDSKMIRQAKQEKVVIATAASNTHPLENTVGVEIWSLPGPGKRVDLGALLRRLNEAGASLVLVEGGAEVHSAFLGLSGNDATIWADQVQFILTPKLIGGRKAPGPVGGQGASHPDQAVKLKEWRWEPLGEDLLVTAKPVK
jgi:diaminohydroxyphosphoribosylaminopyrimidine deaminase/5-amino-6-(5-phosphoribosylamino)uracil reductase